MRIKRFEAPNSTSALALVKKELGENAVILTNKTLDAGTPNQRFEMVAAMDYDLETLTVPSGNGQTSHMRNNSANAGNRPPDVSKPTIYGYNAYQKKQLDRPEEALKKSEKKISIESHDLRMRFADMLRKNGVTPPIKHPCSENFTQPSSTPAALETKRPKQEDVARWRNQLIEQIQAAPPKINARGKATILALIGPTGVGKTTTSAKIAAWYKLRKNYKVALLSMDCYRIGATDQLRTYARIMQIPCEIVLRQKDLTKAIDRHRDCDLIIIDTAGKSPYDNDHIMELAEWFSSFDSIEPQLVLSATTKKEDLQKTIDSYAAIGPTGLILTKIDETRAYAALCQQVANAGIPVSYLATGQKVPEDFFVACKPFLDDLFRRGWTAVDDAKNTFFAKAENAT